MAWSSDVELVTFTFGSSRGTLGEPASSLLKAIPVFQNTRYLVWAATGTVWSPTQEESDAGVGQQGSLSVPSVDQAGWLDEYGNPYSNWYYEMCVQYFVEPIAGPGKVLKVGRNVQPLAAESPIDYDLLESSGTSDPIVAIKYPLRSVNGVEADAFGNVEVTFQASSPGLEFAQANPSSQWSIPHTLGRRPSVTLYDSSGNEIDTDIAATATLVTVTFPSPTSGSAVLA